MIEDPQKDLDEQVIDEQINFIPGSWRAKKIKGLQQKNYLFNGIFSQKFDYHNYSLNTTLTPVFNKDKDIVSLKQENTHNLTLDFDLLKIQAQYKNQEENSLKFIYRVKNLHENRFFSIKDFSFPLIYKNNCNQWELKPKILLYQEPFALEIQGNSQSIQSDQGVVNQQYINSDLKIIQKLNEQLYFQSSLSYKQDKANLNLSIFSKLLNRQLINFENNIQYNLINKQLAFKDSTIKFQKNKNLYTQLSIKPRENYVQIGIFNKFNRNYQFQGIVSKKNNKVKYELGLEIKKFDFANINLFLNEQQRITALVNFNTKQLKFQTLFQSQILAPYQRNTTNYPLQFTVSFNGSHNK